MTPGWVIQQYGKVWRTWGPDAPVPRHFCFQNASLDFDPCASVQPCWKAKFPPGRCFLSMLLLTFFIHRNTGCLALWCYSSQNHHRLRKLTTRAYTAFSRFSWVRDRSCRWSLLLWTAVQRFLSVQAASSKHSERSRGVLCNFTRNLLFLMALYRSRRNCCCPLHQIPGFWFGFPV